MRKMFTLGFQMCSSNSISGMQIGVVKKKRKKKEEQSCIIKFGRIKI